MVLTGAATDSLRDTILWVHGVPADQLPQTGVLTAVLHRLRDQDNQPEPDATHSAPGKEKRARRGLRTSAEIRAAVEAVNK
ncbi:hypothetical protein [Corynebacterium sp. HMSC077B05]|uniref:hypothetical protein n=1 Tax=Corynebacterium sp. HMSC077B05 TaxID=1739252 RepID=UPI0008A608DA|nr:hypothetical protein [Corynebacterium sp. HMSC077B05]OFL77606.1 hypothetical protein HMPREF2748_03595 [Corynebacterium sp. HMSC077B05]